MPAGDSRLPTRERGAYGRRADPVIAAVDWVYATSPEDGAGSLAKVTTMAEIVLFHHAQGQTSGFLAFADELRAAGHMVHAPDVYDGKTFATVEEGVAHARELGFQAVADRSEQAVAEGGLPERLVYAGFSLGVMPAQKLAQIRPGARGALLYHAAVPLGEFGDTWPDGVPLQLHVMEDDDWGDVAENKQLAAEVDGAELFLYPGSAHLFADSSLPDYDQQAAALLLQRTLAFLDALA